MYICFNQKKSTIPCTYAVVLLLSVLKSHSVQSSEEDERLRDEKQRIMDELVLKYAINATKEENKPMESSLK